MNARVFIPSIVLAAGVIAAVVVTAGGQTEPAPTTRPAAAPPASPASPAPPAPPGDPASPAVPSKPAPRALPPGAMMTGSLVEGLENTPGCLGVDLARWRSGRQSICAWFEDKAAVVAWYESEVHQGMMQQVVRGGAFEGNPLEHVADDSGPIMVIASLTPTPRGEPGLPQIVLPISQISIEMFQPLPGGVHIGGRLAPETFVVPGMKAHPVDGLGPPDVNEPAATKPATTAPE